VRNNPKGDIGFLKENSRVNVMLSRARIGMYVLGDFSMLERRRDGMWPNLLRAAREHGDIQPTLDLVCSLHPETTVAVQRFQDVRLLLLGQGDKF
jgi:superfamily I DNA and/or RNA helicase